MQKYTYPVGGALTLPQTWCWNWRRQLWGTAHSTSNNKIFQLTSEAPKLSAANSVWLPVAHLFEKRAKSATRDVISHTESTKIVLRWANLWRYLKLLVGWRPSPFPTLWTSLASRPPYFQRFGLGALVPLESSGGDTTGCWDLPSQKSQCRPW